MSKKTTDKGKKFITQTVAAISEAALRGEFTDYESATLLLQIEILGVLRSLNHNLVTQ